MVTNTGNVHLAVQFFLQLAVILLFCRVVGSIAARLGQPQVVAEMIAGVLLGPSFLGLFWPEIQHSLFPWDKTQSLRDTQSYLFPASQLGLALYMFVVGMEFRTDVIRDKLKSSLSVSAAGMVAPFILGSALGWLIFRHAIFSLKKRACLRPAYFLALRCASQRSDARANYSFQKTQRNHDGNRGNRRWGYR